MSGFDKNKIKITLNGDKPQIGPPSPTFGKKKEQTDLGAGMERVGRHGKSHHTYLKVMEGHKAVEPRTISWEELAQHKTASSAWLSLHGVVYDVTTYLNYHPGGNILLEGCGKQCSNLFEKYHPWVNAKHLLQKYVLGYLK